MSRRELNALARLRTLDDAVLELLAETIIGELDARRGDEDAEPDDDGEEDNEDCCPAHDDDPKWFYSGGRDAAGDDDDGEPSLGWSNHVDQECITPEGEFQADGEQGADEITEADRQALLRETGGPTTVLRGGEPVTGRRLPRRRRGRVTIDANDCIQVQR